MKPRYIDHSLYTCPVCQAPLLPENERVGVLEVQCQCGYVEKSTCAKETLLIASLIGDYLTQAGFESATISGCNISLPDALRANALLPAFAIQAHETISNAGSNSMLAGIADTIKNISDTSGLLNARTQINAGSQFMLTALVFIDVAEQTIEKSLENNQIKVLDLNYVLSTPAISFDNRLLRDNRPDNSIATSHGKER